jgi:RNA polymerase sigma factor (sigma-70 family)
MEEKVYPISKEEAVERYSNLVKWVVKRYWGLVKEYHLWFSFDDLYLYGIGGLMRAVELWDPNKGGFSTYAYSWIKQAILRKISEEVKKAGVKQEPRLENEYGGERFVLEECEYEDEELSDDSYADGIEEWDRLVDSSSLNDRDKLILKMFGDGWTYREIARAVGLTKEGVRQVVMRKGAELLELLDEWRRELRKRRRAK